jgi:flagellar hook-length control protein FliK
VRLPGVASDAKLGAPQAAAASAKTGVDLAEKAAATAHTPATLAKDWLQTVTAGEVPGARAAQGTQATALEAASALAPMTGNAAPAAIAFGRDAAPQMPVSIATPVAAPEFPHALGVQLSVLAHAGVQHAELQLNPAEMGPVSVRIVMDGSDARIEFGADMAATRHAIESGLPELASALRETGLTLTGGGVSQHTRGHGDTGHAPHGAPQRDGRGSVSAGTEPTPVVTRRMVSAGGVDLYA